MSCTVAVALVHWSLYNEGSILSCDTLENSIIITNPERADGFKGVLVDLNLAKWWIEDEAALVTGPVMEFTVKEVLEGTGYAKG